MHGDGAFSILTGICLGIGLAAACGFRVFVPLLVISIAAKAGEMTLSPGWEWIASTPALVCFAVATGLEIIAYYVPWLDHALDTVATPAAVVAGAVVTAACVGDMSPMLRWSLALIAGGGAAAVTQGATVVARAGSTAISGGLTNPVIATAELAGAIGLSILAVLLPFAAAIAAIAVLFLCLRFLFRRFRPVPPTPVA